MKLAFNLLVFAIDFLLIKINHQKFLKISLLFLIILSWSFTFLVIKQKNTPQVETQYVKILENQNQGLPKSQLVVLDKNEMINEIEILQKTEEWNIKNVGLLLNLSQLNKAIGQNELAKKYFEQAKQITPRIEYLEN